MSSQMKRFCAVCFGVLVFLCLAGAGWSDTNFSGAVSFVTDGHGQSGDKRHSMKEAFLNKAKKSQNR